MCHSVHTSNYIHAYHVEIYYFNTWNYNIASDAPTNQCIVSIQ